MVTYTESTVYSIIFSQIEIFHLLAHRWPIFNSLSPIHAPLYNLFINEQDNSDYDESE